LQKKQLKKIIPILAAVLLLAVFVPLHTTKAYGLFGIGDFAATAVNNIIYFALYAIFQAVGSILGFFANLLDSFIRFMSNDYPDAVKSSWDIVRNFANMIFILALIVMAFGTIFDVQKYNWRNMLVPFLIAALLINFSFVIGTYLISVADGLSSIFLRQIGNASERLMNGLALGNITFNGESVAALDAASATLALIAGLIFINVFAVMAMLAMASAAIFAIVRIVFLWFLLVLSPIAWIGYVFPNLRGQTWSEWWKHFFCWCFFLPYYLFFLSFAFIFIGAKPKLAGNTDLASANVGGILSGLFNFNDILFYIISILFMVGGLFIARKLSCMTGTGVGKVFSKIEGGVKKYAPGAAYVRGAWGGLKERGEQIKEKGVLGIGGAQRAREAEAKAGGLIAGIPGLGRVPGAREAAERARLEEINKETERLKTELLRIPAEERQQTLAKARGRGGLAGEAATFEYARQGYSTLKDYKDAMEKFGGETSALGRQYLENLKQAKLSDLFKSPDQELRMARGEEDPDMKRFAELRRALFMDLAKRNQISDLGDYKTAKKLLEPIPGELKSFLGSIKPEYIVGTRELRQDAIRDRTLDDVELERKLVEYMKDKKEINDVQLRQNALAIVGGRSTIEGRSIINEIDKFNPAINIEANLREEREIPIDQPLSDEDNNRIIREIADKIAEKEFADLRKMSGKFWEDEKTQQAVRQTFDGDDIAQLLENAPKEMKRALKDLPEEPRIIIPSGVTTGRTEETQKSREEILRELGKIP
jgi:hypothetical protein